MESKGDKSKYLQALRGDMVQRNMRNKVVPVEFLAYCIEAGVLDCNDEALLFEIEKSFGRRLRPKHPPSMNLASDGGAQRVSSTEGMPVVSQFVSGNVGDGKLPFERSMPTEAMFRETIRVIDEKIKSNITFRGRAFNECIKYNARRDWCTPELFKALLMDQSYVDKLRAAMYPSMVSYCERTFTDGGKTYMVPYITILDKSTVGEKYGPLECEKGMRNTTFYLNNQGGIGMMAGKVYQMYDEADFSSRDAIGKYMKRLEKEFEERLEGIPRANKKRIIDREWKPVEEFLKPYATGKKPIADPAELMDDFMRLHKKVLGGDTMDYFLNLKTGKSYRTVIRNNIKEARRYGNDWFKVFDVTSCMDTSGELPVVRRERIAGEFERKSPGSATRIRAAADRSLRRLHDKMFGLRGDEESLGQEEYDKECPFL